MRAISGVFRRASDGLKAAERLTELLDREDVNLLMPGPLGEEVEEVPTTEDMPPVGGKRNAMTVRTATSRQTRKLSAEVSRLPCHRGHAAARSRKRAISCAPVTPGVRQTSLSPRLRARASLSSHVRKRTGCTLT
jgi:hypothetical protein